MAKDQYINKNKYISSKRSAELAGLTSDYLASLCRAQKLKGRLLGKTWYIEEKALKSFIAKRKAEEEKIRREEERFIPSKEAAKITGYTNDYIGKFCREGKVKSKKIGRAWFVEVKSLKEFVQKNKRKKKVKAKKLSEESKKKYSLHKKIRKVTDLPKKINPVTSLAPYLSKVPVSGTPGLSRSLLSLAVTGTLIFGFLLFGQTTFGKNLLDDTYSALKEKTLIAAKFYDDGFVEVFNHSLSEANDYLRNFENDDVENSDRELVLPEIDIKLGEKSKNNFLVLFRNSLEEFFAGSYFFITSIDDGVEITSRNIFSGIDFIEQSVSSAPKNLLSLSLELLFGVKDRVVETPSYVFRNTGNYFKNLGSNIGEFIDGPENISKFAIRAAIEPLKFSKEFLDSRISYYEEHGPRERGLTAGFFDSLEGGFDNLIEDSKQATFCGLTNFFGLENDCTEPLVEQHTPPKREEPVEIVTKPDEINKTVVVQPETVIERVTERVVVREESLALTEEELQEKFNQLENELRKEIFSLANSFQSGGNTLIQNVYNQIAQTQIIDNLDDLNISNATITDSSFEGTTGVFSETVTAKRFVAAEPTATSTFAGGFAVATDGLVYDFSSGNVGIGTSAPTSKLHVVGDIFTTGNITSGSITATTSAIAPFFVATNVSATSTFAGSLTVDTDVLVVDNTTNTVGIGTTSPYAPLSVVGEVVASYFTATSTTATSTFAGGFAVNTNTFLVDPDANTVGVSTTTPWAQLSVEGQGSTPAFVVSDTSNNTDFIVDSSGEVGVGTTNPEALFHVSGSDGTLPSLATSITKAVISNNSGTTNNVALGLIGGTAGDSIINFGDANDENVGYIDYDHNNDSLFFGVNTQERLRITNSGNVGIGTTSPYAALSVVGQAVFTSFHATSTTATSTISGNFAVDGDVVVGDSILDTLTVVATVDSNLVPNTNATLDLGSPSFYWDDLYIDNVVANNISAASTTIAGTQSDTFTINTDNATSDGEDSSLVFFRGTVTPNAILRWASASDRFELTQDLFIQDETPGTGSTTLTVKAGAGQNTNNLFVLQDNSGTDLSVFDESGRLGIGTNNPGFLIDIATSSGDAQIELSTTDTAGTADTIFRNSIGGTTASNFIFFGDSGDSDIGRIEYDHGDDSLTFRTNTSDAVIIDSSGNVGIGTSTPLSLLHIASDTDAVFILEADADDATETDNPKIELRQDGNTIVGSLGLEGNAGATFTDSLGNAVYLINEDAQELQLGTNNAARLTIDSSGLVGIATTAPQSALEVNGIITANNDLVLKETDYGNNAFRVDVTSTYADLELYRGGVVVTNIAANSGEDNYFNNGGNVGIGTTTPIDILTVSHSTDPTITLERNDGTVTADETIGKISFFSADLSTGSAGEAANIEARAENGDRTDLIFRTGHSTGSGSPTLVDALTIKNTTGNVGIGTTSPSNNLHIAVSGSGNTSDTSNAALTLESSSNDNFIEFLGTNSTEQGITWTDAGAERGKITYAHSSDIMKFFAGGGEVARFSSGNLGIATTTPFGKLATVGDSPTFDVTGAALNRHALTIVDNGTFEDWRPYGGVTTASLHIQSSATDGLLLVPTRSSDGETNLYTTGDFRIYTEGTMGGSGGTLGLTVSDGNVGIGTTSPQNMGGLGFGPLLNIEGTTPALQLISSSGNTSAINLWDGSDRNAVISSIDGGSLAFYTNSNSGTGASVSEKIRITSAGNVGIGTTSPDFLLTIGDGTSSSQTDTAIKSTSSGFGRLLFSDAWGTAPGRVVYDHSDNDLSFWTNSSERLTIDSSGDVGIGTTAPENNKLRVLGSDSTAFDINADQTNDGVHIEISNEDTTNGSFAELTFEHKDGAHGESRVVSTSQGNHASDLHLLTESGVSGVYDGISILSSGNVGIGTTSPFAKLSVAGDIYADGDITVSTITATSSILAPDGTEGSPAYSFTNDPDTGIYRIGNGRLGISIDGGTELDLNGSRLAPWVTNTLSLGSDGLGFASIYASTTVKSAKFEAYDTSATSTFAGGLTVDSTDLVVDPDGNIVSVGSYLDVGSPTTGTGVYNLNVRGISIFRSASDIFDFFYINQNNNESQFEISTNDGTNTWRFVAGGGTTSEDGFHIKNGGNTRVFFEPGGNVGIGTTTPDGTLHVYTASAGNVTASASADNLVIEGSGSSGLSILTPNTSAGFLMFGDPDDNDVGYIEYNHSDNDLAFFTNANERVTIDSSGNLGVGSSTPSGGKLVVYTGASGGGVSSSADELVIEGSGNSGLTILSGSAQDGGIFFADANDTIAAWINYDHNAQLMTIGSQESGGQTAILSGNGGEAIRIDSSQNIAIGTSTPDSNMLHIYDSSRTGNTDQSGWDLTVDGITFLETTDNSNPVLQIRQYGTGDLLDVRDSGNQGTFIVKDGGNVGVGTSTPSQLLHVYDGAAGVAANAASNLILEDSGTNYLSFISPDDSLEGILFGDASDNDIGAIFYSHGEVAGYPSNSIGFRTNATDGQVVIDSLGHLGVGTTTPNGSVHIQSGLSGVGLSGLTNQDDLIVENSNIAGISIFSPDANSSQLVFGSPTDTFGARLRWEHDNDLLSLHTANTGAEFAIATSNGTEALRIDSNQNVGIGTTSPDSSFKLHVQNTSGSGAILTEGSSIAQLVLKDNTGSTDEKVWALRDDAPLFHIGTQSDAFGSFSSKLTINRSGNVGIATTTPWASLSVTNAGSGPSFVVEDSASPDSTPFIIDASGNVGIGTDSPSNILHVAGSSGTNLRLEDNDATTASNATNAVTFYRQSTEYARIGKDTTDSLFRIQVSDNNPISFFIGGNAASDEKVRIDGSGNVGIGTTTPGSLLHVYSSASDDAATFERETTATTLARDTAQLNLKSTGNAADGFGPFLRFTFSDTGVDDNLLGGIAGIRDGGDTEGALAFYAGTNGAEEFLRIDNDGNVGVGTTSPWGKLSVTNTGTGPSLVVEDATSPDSTPFIIDASGSVGIGTASPEELLNVFGTNAAIMAEGNGITKAGFKIKTNDTLRWDINSPSGSSDLRFNNGSSDLVTIQNVGNFGIATTSPWAQLSVEGQGSGPSFVVSDTSNNTDFIVDAVGNVGVGTTDPGDKFVVEVNTNERLGVEHVTSSAITDFDDGHAAIQFSRGSDGSDNLHGIFAYQTSGDANRFAIASRGDIVFATGGGSGYTSSLEVVRFTDDGNVGIGTSTPDSPLVVNTTDSSVTNFLVLKGDRNIGDTEVGILFKDRSTIAGSQEAGRIWTDRQSTQGNFNLVLQAGDQGTGGLQPLGLIIQGDTGYIGVGTSSPDSILHVTAQGSDDGITITNTSDDRLFRLGQESGDAGRLLISDGGTTKIDLNANGTANSYINAGNFGIGTTSPADGLTLEGDQLRLVNNDDTDQLRFVNKGFSDKAWSIFQHQDDVRIWEYDTTIAGASGNNRFTFEAGGNFGIGTTNPDDFLEIEGSLGGTGIHLDSTSGAGINIDRAGTTNEGRLQFSTAGSVNAQIGLDNNSTSNLHIGSNGFGTSWVTINTSSGNVGIGTTSPQTILQAITSSGANLRLSTSDTAVNANETVGTITFNAPNELSGTDAILVAAEIEAEAEGNFSTASNATSLIFKTGSSETATEKFKIDSAGNIFAGSLETNTTIQDDLCWDSVSGELEVNTSNSCNSSSSERFKENIINSTYSLSEIAELRPVFFNYLPTYAPDPADQNRKIGFIAEEVEGIVPEVIQYDLEGLPSGIDYGNLTSLLAGGIQEIISKVDILNAPTTTPSIYINESGQVGIGTTTPEYALHVAGDIAGTAFINTSTKESKKDIEYIDELEKEGFVNDIRNLKVAQYRYNFEDPNNPLRIGLIAEESPDEILSASKNGVDLYKLTTLTLTGVQELFDKVDDLELRLTNLENSGTAASSNSVIETLITLGIEAIEGVVNIASLAVSNLTIGSNENPTGITLYDEITGEPYCLSIRNGVSVANAGNCGTVSTPSTSSAPVITINGNNPAEVAVGTNYADLGATYTDEDLNLGIHATVNGVDVGDMSNISIDTSADGEHSIIYRVTDNDGNTGMAERIVIVGNGATTTPEIIIEEPTATSTPPVLEEPTATSTPPTIEEPTATTTPPIIEEEPTATSTPSTSTSTPETS